MGYLGHRPPTLVGFYETYIMLEHIDKTSKKQIENISLNILFDFNNLLSRYFPFISFPYYDNVNYK